MLQLDNATPFAAALQVLPDPQGIDTLHVVVKATFTLGSRVEVSPEQEPLRSADEYLGEPGQSSLLYPSETHPAKPATDVVLVGSAQAPHGRRARRLLASLRVGPVMRQIQVSGDRSWTGSWLGSRFTEPEPFEKMPLVWERAYGGQHVDVESGRVLADDWNPIGRGFRGERSRREIAGMPLPNLEDPADLIGVPGDEPDPVGFGCIVPSWLPRRSYAGTYDEAWQRTRAPFLPKDFDARFLCCAAPGLVCPGYLRGGEPIDLVNVSTHGPLRLSVPTCELQVKVDVAGRREAPPCRLETLLIEPELERMTVAYRATLACDKRALQVESVLILLKSLVLGDAR